MRSRHVVVVVLDGLRPDMAVPNLTPNLNALRRNGVWHTSARSVYPSVTRVISASLATGSLPIEHGLHGNRMALAAGNSYKVYNTGHPEFISLWRGMRGQTLRRATLAQLIAPLGEVRVFSNVSPGASYLQDPDGHGFVCNRGGSFAPGRIPTTEGMGLKLGITGDAELTHLCIGHLEKALPPRLTVLWLSEPDDTGDHYPLGSPEHLAALAAADACLGQIADAIRRREDCDWLLIACSDHGQETEIDTVDVALELVRAGLKADPDSTEIVVAPNGSAGLVYCAPGQGAGAAEVANFLRRSSWCGEIFPFPPSKDAEEDSLDRPDLFFSMAKHPGCNAYGIPGLTFATHDPEEPKGGLNRGTHGGCGIHELASMLLACGPGFPLGAVQAKHVSLLDVAPTVLTHLGLYDEARSMRGTALQQEGLS